MDELVNPGSQVAAGGYMKRINKNQKKGFTLLEIVLVIAMLCILLGAVFYGSDGLEFRRLSPTGTNFIESLNWFIIPYEEDAQGNVIKHSKWLSDGLCHNYIAYQDKINRLTSNFKTLSTQRTEKEDEIVQEQQELSNLQNTLNQIENAIWVINKTYFEEAVNRADWQREISRKNSTIASIEAQNDLIRTLADQLDNIDDMIANLRYEISKDNPANFTVEQIREMKIV